VYICDYFLEVLLMKQLVSSLSGNPLIKKIKVKDYLLSGETFDLYYDRACDMLVTKPVPANLPDYYKSATYQPHRLQRKSFFDRIYRWVRNRSFRYKYRLITNNHPKVRSVLDYGTATGDFLAFLQTKGIDVCGVEPDNDARRIANSLLSANVFERIEDCNRKFDVITLWHVFEHVDKPDELLEKLIKKLHPGGLIVIAVPNYKSYDAVYYKQYWAAYDVPRHLWHFSPLSIHKIFEKHRLQLLAQKPLIFDSFYVSLLSEQYMTGKKKWISAFITGLKSNFKARKTGNYSSLIYIAKQTDKN